jgi:hypothetical protein
MSNARVVQENCLQFLSESCMRTEKSGVILSHSHFSNDTEFQHDPIICCGSVVTFHFSRTQVRPTS